MGSELHLDQTAATGSSSDTNSAAATDPAHHHQTAATGSTSDTSSAPASDPANSQTAAAGSSSGTSSAPVTNSSPATGTAQDSSANSHQNGGQHFHYDIAALLQALQQNNTNAVNNAVTTLGNDVHAASAADSGCAPSFTDHHIEHCTHHFEHMWG